MTPAALLLALTLVAAPAPPVDTAPGAPDQIHAELWSWGSLVFGWTVDANGHALIAYRRPGERVLSGAATDTRSLEVGPEGYAEIKRRIAVARVFLKGPVPCDELPLPTDGPYGEIAWKAGAQVEEVNLASRCSSPQRDAMFTALRDIQTSLINRAGDPRIEGY